MKTTIFRLTILPALLVILAGEAMSQATGSVPRAADPTVIDDCQYADEAAARAAWVPMTGTAPVTLQTKAGVRALRLSCNFAGTAMKRASWDRRVSLDLSACQGIQFQFLCPDATPVSHFSLYFESGDGWYVSSFFPNSAGWNTVNVGKADMTIEGQPAGWSAISAVRLSAWRGADVDTEFFVSDLRLAGVLGADTLVALVRCDLATETRPADRSGIARYHAGMARAFDELGVGCATLSDLDLTAARLGRARLVVLPHNPVMPDSAVDALIAYLEDGGRLLAFYGMPARLRPLVNIDAGGFARPTQPGGFAAMRLVEGALPGAPPLVRQNSWNIAEPKAVPGRSRTVGEWLDAHGRSTGHGAIVVSSNCIEMAHVLLDDDRANQRRLLLAMAGHLVPEIWQQVADASLARIGRLAGFRDFDEAMAQIGGIARDHPEASALLEEARRRRGSAVALRDEGRFPEACEQADDAARRMLDAFCAAQRPLAGEFRAFWCHSAFGVPGLDWDAAIERLATNGFTAIMPNMLWGGVAFYESEVLPVAPEVATSGDQIAQCLAAARRHGLQVHVWKVNWNLGRAPTDFVARMRRQNRLQADSKGQEEPWLCPSHPENQQLEIASMVEVARRYEVDGIHFDYIRYPDGDHCFCAGCRERFEQARGASLPRWPQDVLTDGAPRQFWLDWRRGHITAVVKAVSEQARAVRPKVKLSAAVYRNWVTDRDSVAQDWKLWCERGYLDFVCPMNYTASDAQFENWVRQQRVWAGRTPCYPGIGAWELTPDRVIGQIQLARRHGTGGFVLFNYDGLAAGELLPRLGRGLTKPGR
ncbi:MAG: family 10 glycosylhydrolase [Limisphaerales bacterium]